MGTTDICDICDGDLYSLLDYFCQYEILVEGIIIERLCPTIFVHLSGCEHDYQKILQWISTKIGGKLGLYLPKNCLNVEANQIKC